MVKVNDIIGFAGSDKTRIELEKLDLKIANSPVNQIPDLGTTIQGFGVAMLSIAAPITALGLVIEDFINIDLAPQILRILEDIEITSAALRKIRLPGETINSYVSRNPEMLDDLEIRWEYQCWVLLMPLRAIRAFLWRGES